MNKITFYYNYRIINFVLIPVCFIVLIYFAKVNWSLPFVFLFLIIATLIFSKPSLIYYTINEKTLRKKYIFITLSKIELDNIDYILGLLKKPMDAPVVIKTGNFDHRTYYIRKKRGNEVKLGALHYVNQSGDFLVNYLVGNYNCKLILKEKYTLSSN